MEGQLISQVTIEDEMRQSYMDYAMSVIVGRALPDVRDGLKPVQRRVLYAMFTEGLVSNRKHSKCAGVVGEVLKRLHPHGDGPVYDALVRLAQSWTLRYPLIDGQGNFGSVDGDPAAAYRYTECRMTALSESLLQDINKDTVEFIPNFDESSEEPVVLPAVLPNLLINGADGIAVGMATHIPPHNIGEIINATQALIKNNNLSVDELMEYVPGPDFPTGGIIFGRSSIRSAYSTGRGIVQVRAKAGFEKIKNSSREVEAIVITEIPFQVNKARLVERIAELVNEKQIEGISKLRDESDRNGMRIVVELKRDATGEVVLNQLFKATAMQESYGVINLAIVEGKPVICSLKELILHFVNHRRDVVTRRTEFELKQAKERMHLLEGFRIALLNIDDVIALIKKAETVKDAKDGLMSRYQLSQIQAQAILELRLQKLTGMERLAVEKEHADLAAEIARLTGILSDRLKIDGIISDELKKMKEQFGDPRRTEIVDGGVEIMVEDMIEDEEMAVSISHQGYVKRTPLNVYRSQKRGGKGISGTAKREDDFIEHLFVASTLSHLLVFTSLGRLYWQKVYEIPETGRTTRGRALINLLDLKEEEKLTAILAIREFTENRFVVMATKQGVIKKVSLMEFSRMRKGGIIACSIDEGDTLIGAGISSGSDEFLVATKEGMSIRFAEDEVRAMGRTARGVKSITLEPSDEVVSMTIISKDVAEDRTLFTVCENGFGKRTKLSDYRSQGRGGKGIIDIRTTDRNGPVTGTATVSDEDDLMIITSVGNVIRIRAKDVSVIGRNTQGVKLIGLEEGEKVVALAPVVESVEDGAE
jgi:DNA gyrase subunit A